MKNGKRKVSFTAPQFFIFHFSFFAPPLRGPPTFHHRHSATLHHRRPRQNFRPEPSSEIIDAMTSKKRRSREGQNADQKTAEAEKRRRQTSRGRNRGKRLRDGQYEYTHTLGGASPPRPRARASCRQATALTGPLGKTEPKSLCGNSLRYLDDHRNMPDRE